MSFFDQNHLNVITNHIAWHGKLNQFMSELFLYAHKPMTYILWQSAQDVNYFFSYIVDGFTVYHKMFLFDPNSSIWTYLCGQLTHQSKDLYEILQIIMEAIPTNDWQPLTHTSHKSALPILSSKR